MRIYESKYPILILSHHNCEIHCCHLDGYKENITALFNRMNIIEHELSSAPADIQYKIWYNLDESKLDKSVMKSVTESIFRLQNHISKIAFIGLHGIYKWRFENMLKQILRNQVLPRAYFSDAELAKEWLI